MADDALRAAVLRSVAAADSVNSLALALQHGAEHQAVIGTIKSLQTFEGLITATPHAEEGWHLSPEGEDIVAKGSHELRVLAVIADAGMTRVELEASPAYAALGDEACKLGMQQATRLKLIKMEKSADKTSVVITKLVRQVGLTTHNVPPLCVVAVSNTGLLPPPHVVINSSSVSTPPSRRFAIAAARRETERREKYRWPPLVA